ncbi:MAG: C2H2-type zinc finger protein [Dehalococcoidia bacterium]
MTKETEEQGEKINWTPIIVIGAAGLGIYLILKLLLGENAANREQARAILEDWQQEFDVLKPYVESIYFDNRIPTEQEIAVLSSMLDQMRTKEITINELSKSVFKELTDILETAAKNWWLVPVVILTPIAGYLTYQLVKGWKNRRQPPPNFPCPKCGAVFATEGALKNHIETAHAPTLQFASEAQQKFAQTSSWVQNAVAVESYYDKTFTNWRTWSLSEIGNLNWGLTSAIVYGIGAAAETAALQTALLLLLA